MHCSPIILSAPACPQGAVPRVSLLSPPTLKPQQKYSELVSTQEKFFNLSPSLRGSLIASVSWILFSACFIYSHAHLINPAFYATGYCTEIVFLMLPKAWLYVSDTTPCVLVNGATRRASICYTSVFASRKAPESQLLTH